MKKKIIQLISGIILIIGGIVLMINSGDAYQGNTIFGTFVLYGAGGWILANCIIKRNKKDQKKDELTKKAGYTALALTVAAK